MRYVRLYCDVKGESRFEDSEFTFQRGDFAPPAPPLDVSEVFDASAFMLIRLPAAYWISIKWGCFGRLARHSRDRARVVDQASVGCCPSPAASSASS